jgi:hypothetical protein
MPSGHRQAGAAWAMARVIVMTTAPASFAGSVIHRVNLTAWRPDGREEEQSQQWVMFGGVARKPVQSS